MSNFSRLGRLAVAASAASAFSLFSSMALGDEAHVTKVVRDVKLLREKAKPKVANVNDAVRDGTAVRTGDASRSELTFVDLTIERLGANTLFSFNHGGRNVQLEGGSMLLRIPKDSGGASLSTSAVTVGITGTTVILESSRKGRNRLFVLEGGAKLWLNKNHHESVYVHGGQMEDVPPGATKLPPPVPIDLNDLMKKNPLITDFPPLPSRDLIARTASNPPVYQGQPVGGAGPGPVVIVPPFIGPIGIPIGGGANPGGHNNPVGKGKKNNPNNNQKNPAGNAAANNVAGAPQNPAGAAAPKGKKKKPGHP